MKLNFKKYGDSGFPLLILHGLLGSLDNWSTLGKSFAEQFQVYIIDQRDHGKSPHSDELSYPNMVADLKEFMDDHQIESCYLLGHSMGGKTVMNFAVQFPHMVEKLIVVDIAPRSYPVHHHQILEGLSAVNFDQVTSRNEVEEVLTPYIPEFTVRQFLMKNLFWVEKGKLAWRFNLPVIKKDIEKISLGLEADAYFTNPTLFIDGENSNYIEEEDVDMIDEIFPRNQIETFENCGHWVHAEAPEEFYQTVVDFLVS